MSQRTPTTEARGHRHDAGQPRLLALRCHVQHYDWGSSDFIPGLLGLENPENEPYAELWMGAHPDLPAEANVNGGRVPLDTMIESAPDEILGPAVARAFAGRLPYLFKVLSAKAPLSIQAHPSKKCAEEGFERENRMGVPLSGEHRNYHDKNHKPELITALTHFYGLRGFRPLEEIAALPRAVPEFGDLMPGFTQTPAGLEALYGKLMSLSQNEVDAILDPLIERLKKAQVERPFRRNDREYWVLTSDEHYSTAGHRDRGLFSIYLLNLVHLKPGEAMFLPAGILHAYLEGSGIEIMANSNNVLRGGLTRKNVDVPELLANVTFEGAAAKILRPVQIPGSRAWKYATPLVCEFELHRLEIDAELSHENGTDHSAEIVILVSADEPARVTATSGEQTLPLRRGSVFLAPFGTDYTISATGRATLYKAAVRPNPVDSPPMFRGWKPTALAFGTSGLRGLLTDITDLEAYINTRGFLDDRFAAGDIARGDVICIAGDRRPSTESPDRSIMRAVARAIGDAALEVDNLGLIPTPALTSAALRRGCASVMITGSHIPFDRNGIKFNKSSGEILKADEASILQAVAAVRRAEYERPEAESLFQDDGMFKPGESRPLPPVNDEGRETYKQRYLDFFPPRGLAGKRIVFFQHSAVGRDLFVELLRDLGAEVHPAGASEAFIPIDTEDIPADRLADLQRMADEVARAHGPVDAVLSTDGDSDRPLLCGVDAEGKVRFYGGDLLGIIVADYLGADAISVPISVNDAVDLYFGARGTRPTKTKIGSPHVIKSMQDAPRGRHIVGWEANGGFLLGSAVERNGRWLEALPTRDAALPLLAALFASIEEGCSLVELFAKLPPRFSRAGLIDEFPQPTSRAIVETFAPGARSVEAMGAELSTYFTPEDGFDRVVDINAIDGVRVTFANGDIAHIRPSGNAPQLRLYACADTQKRADEIVAMAIREPDGLLRRLEAGLGP